MNRLVVTILLAIVLAVSMAHLAHAQTAPPAPPKIDDHSNFGQVPAPGPQGASGATGATGPGVAVGGGQQQTPPPPAPAAAQQPPAKVKKPKKTAVVKNAPAKKEEEEEGDDDKPTPPVVAAQTGANTPADPCKGKAAGTCEVSKVEVQGIPMVIVKNIDTTTKKGTVAVTQVTTCEACDRANHMESTVDNVSDLGALKDLATKLEAGYAIAHGADVNTLVASNKPKDKKDDEGGDPDETPEMKKRRHDAEELKLITCKAKREKDGTLTSMKLSVDKLMACQIKSLDNPKLDAREDGDKIRDQLMKSLSQEYFTSHQSLVGGKDNALLAEKIDDVLNMADDSVREAIVGAATAQANEKLVADSASQAAQAQSMIDQGYYQLAAQLTNTMAGESALMQKNDKSLVSLSQQIGNGSSITDADQARASALSSLGSNDQRSAQLTRAISNLNAQLKGHINVAQAGNNTDNPYGAVRDMSAASVTSTASSTCSSTSLNLGIRPSCLSPDRGNSTDFRDNNWGAFGAYSSFQQPPPNIQGSNLNALNRQVRPGSQAVGTNNLNLFNNNNLGTGLTNANLFQSQLIPPTSTSPTLGNYTANTMLRSNTRGSNLVQQAQLQQPMMNTAIPQAALF